MPYELDDHDGHIERWLDANPHERAPYEQWLRRWEVNPFAMRHVWIQAGMIDSALMDFLFPADEDESPVRWVITIHVDQASYGDVAQVTQAGPEDQIATLLKLKP